LSGCPRASAKVVLTSCCAIQPVFLDLLSSRFLFFAKYGRKSADNRLTPLTPLSTAPYPDRSVECRSRSNFFLMPHPPPPRESLRKNFHPFLLGNASFSISGAGQILFLLYFDNLSPFDCWSSLLFPPILFTRAFSHFPCYGFLPPSSRFLHYRLSKAFFIVFHFLVRSCTCFPAESCPRFSSSLHFCSLPSFQASTGGLSLFFSTIFKLDQSERSLSLVRPSFSFHSCLVILIFSGISSTT